ncbi:TnsA endonuclease N-terminal domain-containing protein [Parvibaculum sp.]|uniref:TnsA endonuclease N-terminal domain-containing protein n=1 Tax=Parvibaculum sp. TaxID=2024848 RepID=UPI0025DE6878|nr:TnsA endonuclease N-terminal domain-containing protein [Parvibaculum sp.]
MSKAIGDFACFANHKKVKADIAKLNREARIVTSTTGGPLRTIVTGTKRRPTGQFMSTKTGRAQPYESQAELLFMQQCEANHEVVTWLAQPHRLEMFVEGEKLIYFPDFNVLYADGREVVVEIKRDKTKEVYGKLAVKLEKAAYVYRSLNIRFQILDLTDLKKDPRCSNAEEIHRHARTRFFHHEVFPIIDQLHRCPSGTIPLGRAVEILGGNVIGHKKLCAMIVRRHFGLDLDARLSADTPVFPVPID